MWQLGPIGPGRDRVGVPAGPSAKRRGAGKVLSGTGAEPGRAGPGQVVAGRYRLLERIGSGGMGSVWLAEDPVLGRRVALKKMHAPPGVNSRAEATAYERMRREARSVARISHPNVVAVHDVADHEGLPCIVMEYVPSRTLGEVLDEHGPVTADEAVRIGRGMIGALRAAHAAGVLHRDVKPGNVLLGTDGRVVLTDFGIATTTDTMTLTRTGEVIGSMDYLAPERLRGGPPAAASDLWALGATLYEAVEGRTPFHRDTAMATAYAICADPPRPPARDTPLGPLIEHLLAKDPANRPSGEDVELWLRARATPGAAPFATTPRIATTPRNPPAADRGRTVAAAGTAPRRRTARRRAVLAATAVLLAGAAAAGIAVVAQDWGDGARPETSPTAAPSRDTAPVSPLPEGYHFEEEKESGLSVPVPDGWRPADTADSDLAYTGPEGLAGLRVSLGDLAASDQLQRWKDDRERSIGAGKLPGYGELRMQRTTYRGMPAAVWEFTFRGRAREFRAVYLGFGEPGGKEYALYLSAPSTEWDRHREVFDVVRQNIRIKGADTPGGSQRPPS
ncbi:serine/threonine protein kinase [Streptomyces lycii]|uniref:non-specific serine/threonine protein kinase n=1 Tax=Streptomyces lycii TaxID=2654337 RepID=A0ABQ7FFX7_9ACTN|nr:serine/threonine protein kinase [Streptomyces lycii]